jgi:steroid delta-isomerase-like uncharacterized protein
VDEQGILAHVSRMYDAFNRGDFDTDLEGATDDIEIVTVAYGETSHGKEAFREWLARWKRAVPDGRAVVVSQLVGKDGITNECRFVGTNTGPLESPMGTLPATGKSFDAPFVEVWRFRDGKTCSIHNYSDTLTLLTQLGLAPQPEGVTAQ